jgi:hypothetical protein
MTSGAYGEGMYVHARAEYIYSSSDLINWNIYERAYYGISDWEVTIFGGGCFMCYSENGYVSRSCDGVNWIDTGATYEDVYPCFYTKGTIFKDERYVSVHFNYPDTGQNGIIYSEDGYNWFKYDDSSGLPVCQSTINVAKSNDIIAMIGGDCNAANSIYFQTTT